MSPIIRALTWSDWSHAALISSDGKYVIEATGSHGVRKDTLEALVDRSSRFKIFEFEVEDSNKIWAIAEDQLGKPYDWTAVIGIVFSRDWSENDRWFCSELVAYCFSQAGSPLVRGDLTNRIVPQQLYMVSFNEISYNSLK